MVTAPNDPDRWLVHGTRPIYESAWIKVGLADISQPSGARFEHHVVWLPPAAMTVVLDDAGENVLLAWRHRFVPDVWNWELPGGLVDEGEDPERTAAREVEEETGYRPRSMERIATFEPMIGMVNSPHHVYLARGAKRVGATTELNEGRFQWVPLSKTAQLIADGQVVNSGTLVGLLHVHAFERRQEPQGP